MWQLRDISPIWDRYLIRYYRWFHIGLTRSAIDFLCLASARVLNASAFSTLSNTKTTLHFTYDSTVLTLQGGGGALRRRSKATSSDASWSRTWSKDGDGAREGPTGAGARATVG